MYKITIEYVVPSLGFFNDFDVYSNTPLGKVEDTIKKLVIEYIQKYDNVTCLPESITYAKIERVKLLKGLIYA